MKRSVLLTKIYSSQTKFNVNEVVTTLIRPKVPVKDDVCGYIMLGILMAFIAVIVAVEDTESLLAINCHRSVSTTVIPFTV